MDSDYCLICDKKTLGGIYCSQSCRLLDIENNNAHLPHEQHIHPEDVLATGSTTVHSTNTSPSASPQFTPTRASNLPSLPILNSLDRYMNRAASFSTTAASPKPSSGAATTTTRTENTSIWRRRSILFYSV